MTDCSCRDADWIDVTWKVPMHGDRVLAVLLILPDSLVLLGSPNIRYISGARIQRGTYKSNGEPLTGKRTSIDGLSALQTDVLLPIEFKDGVRHSAIMQTGFRRSVFPNTRCR